MEQIQLTLEQRQQEQDFVVGALEDTNRALSELHMDVANVDDVMLDLQEEIMVNNSIDAVSSSSLLQDDDDDELLKELDELMIDDDNPKDKDPLDLPVEPAEIPASINGTETPTDRIEATS